VLRRVFAVLILTAFLSPVASFAQEATPTAEQILNRYVQALGGRENILKVTSRVMTGIFQIDGQDHGTVEVFYKTPNLYHSIVKINEYGTIDSGHDADGGWEKSPELPLRAQTGADLARSRRELDLHKAVKLAQLYRSMTVKGKGQTADHDAWLLVAVPEEGYPETMYFDTKSGLLLRVDLQLDTEGGPTAVERHYDDYRLVEGVRVAHVVRFANPGINYTLKFTSVQNNAAISPEQLARPAN